MSALHLASLPLDLRALRRWAAARGYSTGMDIIGTTKRLLPIRAPQRPNLAS